jgi:hypothetical protein
MVRDIAGQVDPGGAEIRQHYELFNERVIVAAVADWRAWRGCGHVAGREALAAAAVQRNHDSSKWRLI